MNAFWEKFKAAVIKGDKETVAALSAFPLSMGYGQTIWNYDFTSQTVSSSGVDWAASMLFYNNASINKVKNIVGGTLLTTGRITWNIERWEVQ